MIFGSFPQTRPRRVLRPRPVGRCKLGFWDRTFAAQVVIALRQKLLASDDKRDQAVGRINLVPRAQVQRKGL